MLVLSRIKLRNYRHYYSWHNMLDMAPLSI